MYPAEDNLHPIVSEPSILASEVNPFQDGSRKSNHDLQPISWKRRIVLVVGGLLGLGLITIAICLPPDSKGFGTHQKLGFPPCTFIQLYQTPCPSCGMTTSWSRLMRGDLFGALHANCGGTLLALCTLVLSPWFLVSGLLGRWWLAAPDMVAGFFILLGITLITIIQWLIWIVFFPL